MTFPCHCLIRELGHLNPISEIAFHNVASVSSRRKTVGRRKAVKQSAEVPAPAGRRTGRHPQVAGRKSLAEQESSEGFGSDDSLDLEKGLLRKKLPPRWDAAFERCNAIRHFKVLNLKLSARVLSSRSQSKSPCLLPRLAIWTLLIWNQLVSGG